MKTCKYLKKRKTQKKYKNRRYKSVSRCRSYNRKPMKTIKKNLVKIRDINYLEELMELQLKILIYNYLLEKKYLDI